MGSGFNRLVTVFWSVRTSFQLGTPSSFLAEKIIFSPFLVPDFFYPLFLNQRRCTILQQASRIFYMFFSWHHFQSRNSWFEVINWWVSWVTMWIHCTAHAASFHVEAMSQHTAMYLRYTFHHRLFFLFD